MQVWGICSDGPLAGTVFEVSVTDVNVEITTDDYGAQLYRRCGWGVDRGHRIAKFRFVHAAVN